MNANALLEYYERIVDDAIASLRRFIVDLAVRGQVVPQNPGDEPARELLRQITTEKAQLVKSAEIRQQRIPGPADPAR
jgi:type I restriction enzyme, S subunit